MEQNKQQNTEAVGLERFHKITIGAGMMCMGLMIWRYWTQYSATESNRYLAYALISTALLLGTAVYLWRFSKKGI
ncbi:MAG: hypothetical protein ACI97A_003994 [Planctomycetota bacterium]|jgi:hypothetical protein